MAQTNRYHDIKLPNKMFAETNASKLSGLAMRDPEAHKVFDITSENQCITLPMAGVQPNILVKTFSNGSHTIPNKFIPKAHQVNFAKKTNT